VKRRKQGAHCWIHGPGASKLLRESSNSSNAPHYYSDRFQAGYRSFCSVQHENRRKVLRMRKHQGVIRIPVDIRELQPSNAPSVYALFAGFSPLQSPVTYCNKHKAPVASESYLLDITISIYVKGVAISLSAFV
jgi:hypothetical protein